MNHQCKLVWKSGALWPYCFKVLPDKALVLVKGFVINFFNIRFKFTGKLLKTGNLNRTFYFRSFILFQTDQSPLIILFFSQVGLSLMTSQKQCIFVQINNFCKRKSCPINLYFLKLSAILKFIDSDHIVMAKGSKRKSVWTKAHSLDPSFHLIFKKLLPKFLFKWLPMGLQRVLPKVHPPLQ